MLQNREKGIEGKIKEINAWKVVYMAREEK
jgi:hypothetical protein